MNKGKIVQVSGPVVDVEFLEGKLPKLRDALEVVVDGDTQIMEVSQLLGNRRVRCIILSQSEGLFRGMEVTATGHGITVPVGDKTIGRMFNVLGKPIDGGEEVSKTILPTWKAILFTVIGLVGVVVGGEGVVYSAQHIALDIGTSFGLDSNVVGLVVGLTVVAVGTSLPELVTSAVAAKKGENEIIKTSPFSHIIFL